jgi:hypothetical protein
LPIVIEIAANFLISKNQVLSQIAFNSFHQMSFLVGIDMRPFLGACSERVNFQSLRPSCRKRREEFTLRTAEAEGTFS